MIYEKFPEPYIQLQQELSTDFHPRLQSILRINGGTADDVDLKLAQIAAYCEIVLDGEYTLEDRIKLCTILVKRLKERRQHPATIHVIGDINGSTGKEYGTSSDQDFSIFMDTPDTKQ